MLFDSSSDEAGVNIKMEVANADQLIQKILRKRGFPVLSSSSSAAEQSATGLSPKRARHHDRKRVRFSNHMSTLSYSCSDFDIGNSWYSRQEYRGFSQDCRRLLEAADGAASGGISNGDEDSDFPCIRGLEDHLMPNLYLMKRRRKKTLIRMIVQQCRLHRKHSGGLDSDCLRSISTMLSRQSRYWARDLGQLDEKER